MCGNDVLHSAQFVRKEGYNDGLSSNDESPGQWPVQRLKIVIWPSSFFQIDQLSCLFLAYERIWMTSRPTARLEEQQPFSSANRLQQHNQAPTVEWSPLFSQSVYVNWARLSVLPASMENYCCFACPWRFYSARSQPGRGSSWLYQSLQNATTPTGCKTSTITMFRLPWDGVRQHTALYVIQTRTELRRFSPTPTRPSKNKLTS